MRDNKKAKQYVSTIYVEAEQFNYPNEVPTGFEVKYRTVNNTPYAHKKSKVSTNYDLFLNDTDWVVRNCNCEQRMTNENFCRSYVTIEDVHTLKNAGND